MSASIEQKVLDETDIGRGVIYNNGYGKEYGKLSSFREDGAIFVRFLGPNGERCNPESLKWENN
jgi:hypothetical protein